VTGRLAGPDRGARRRGGSPGASQHDHRREHERAPGDLDGTERVTEHDEREPTATIGSRHDRIAAAAGPTNRTDGSVATVAPCA
jgi:hypothetical protein